MMTSINRSTFIKTLLVIFISFSGCRNAPKIDKPVVKLKPEVAEKTALKVETPDRLLQKKLTQWNQTKPLVLTLDDALLKSKGDIETLATFLKQQPELNVLIEGHSESTDQHDLGLSKRHATAVQFGLMKQGISSKRITVKIFADSQNSRVDVKITKKR